LQPLLLRQYTTINRKKQQTKKNNNQQQQKQKTKYTQQLTIKRVSFAFSSLCYDNQQQSTLK
jgi:hypothetical protein